MLIFHHYYFTRIRDWAKCYRKSRTYTHKKAVYSLTVRTYLKKDAYFLLVCTLIYKKKLFIRYLYIDIHKKAVYSLRPKKYVAEGVHGQRPIYFFWSYVCFFRAGSYELRISSYNQSRVSLRRNSSRWCKQDQVIRYGIGSIHESFLKVTWSSKDTDANIWVWVGRGKLTKWFSSIKKNVNAIKRTSK